jgi:amino acid transporter
LAAPRRLTLIPLVAATYFMVCGGPYGLEELVARSGYERTLVLLLLTPLIWSLPTALMVGELSGAIPEEGGYYAWVRRALGPFWGFQEAWLSLVASVFDMAIYPTLFVCYLGRLFPSVATGWPSIVLGVGMIAICAAWNVRGSRAVGLASLVMSFALLTPFVLLVLVAAAGHAVTPPPAAPASGGWLAAILVAMWNFMGWDNASTVAGEVERPQRTYPLAMIITVGLVAATYLLPVLACRRAGLDPHDWDTGAWVDAATSIGGRGLGLAVVLGGIVCAVGMFNALVMSYSRVPLALATDGFLPKIVARLHPRSGAPWVAILLCAVAYASSLGLGFDRLVELDVLLYGLSLLLEFVALVALRIREPLLPRRFQIPGGLPGAIAIGVAPMTLLVIALVQGRAERTGGIPALLLGGCLVCLGPPLYLVGRRFRRT